MAMLNCIYNDVSIISESSLDIKLIVIGAVYAAAGTACAFLKYYCKDIAL